MKLVLSMDEVKMAVAEYLAERGYIVNATDIKAETHHEGLYDDQEQVLDGVSVVIEPKNRD